MKKLLAAVMFVACMGTVAMAENGVSLDVNGNVVIQNVYFKPFGLVNMVKPWTGIQEAYYLDLLHQPASQSIGIEGSFLKFDAFKGNTQVLNINWLISSIVAGEENKGLCGLSIDLSNTKNVDENKIRLGIWGASAFDGLSPYAGIKAYKKF